MTLSLPNLTLTITPPGGSATNYTSYLAYDGSSQSISITQNFGRQGDTATFVLVDDWQGHSTPQVFIPVLSQIKLVDNTLSTTLFAGVVNDPTLFVDSANRNEWILQCTDYTFYADNAVVQGIFNGYTIDQIVVALTQQANCGINAATIANGGFVAPAPSVNTINFNYSTLAAAWRGLASQASSSSPYGWYVDSNRNLHFYDSSTAQASGVTFTTAPTAAGAGSTTEGHIMRDSQFGYEWDGTTIHNVIIVQGANQTVNSPTTGSPTNTFRADGETDSWALKYTVSSISKLLVGTANTSVTLVQAGESSTAEWQVAQNANGQWFLITDSAPSAGTVLKIWYTYQVPIIARAQNTASQAAYTGPNSGKFVEYISDSSLTTASMALAKAQAERQEYGFAVERATFNTDESFFGWVRAGQTFTYNNALLPDTQNSNQWTGVNDTFLCIANTISFTANGGYRQMQVTGVRI